MKHNKRVVFSDFYNLPLLTVPAEPLLQATTAAPFSRTIAGHGRASPTTHHPDFSEDNGGRTPLSGSRRPRAPKVIHGLSSVGEGGCDARFSSSLSFFSTQCFLCATFHSVKMCACFGFTSWTEPYICCNPAVRGDWHCALRDVQCSLLLQKPFLHLKHVLYL